MRLHWIIIAFIVLSVPVYANEAMLYVPAVRETEYGYQGVLGTLAVKIEPGSGHVYVDTLPLTEIDTQSSARLAKEVAEDVLNIKLDKYDLFFVIRSDSPVIGGPSAGGAMAAAAIAAYLNLSIDKNVVMTGTINPDGSIGPIGSVFEKAQAVAKNNGTIFLVPEGQSTVRTQETKSIGMAQTVSEPVEIDLKAYAKEKWNLRVVEISRVEDAIKYITGYKIDEPERGLQKENPYLTAVMKEMAEEKMKAAEKKLEETKTALSSSSLPYDYSVQLQQLISSQEKTMAEAKSLFAGGKYYSSTSKLFVMSIHLSYAKSIVGFIESKNSKSYAENLIALASDNVKIVESRVNETMGKIDNITDIEIISAAEERAIEAEGYVNSAWQSFYQGKYMDSLYYSSYAMERASTADTWLSLASSFSGSNVTFDFTTLKTLAERRIEDAVTSTIYAASVGIDIADEDILLQKSKESYQNGAYSTAVFNAIMARASANMKMETRGLTKDIIAGRLPKYENDALLAIQRSEAAGAFPILAISYLEYGQSFADSDAESALRYMKYAKEFAEVSKDIYRTTNGEADPETPATAVPAPKTEADMTVFLIVVAFASGAVIGTAAGLKLRRKEKRRYRIR